MKGIDKTLICRRTAAYDMQWCATAPALHDQGRSTARFVTSTCGALVDSSVFSLMNIPCHATYRGCQNEGLPE